MNWHAPALRIVNATRLVLLPTIVLAGCASPQAQGPASLPPEPAPQHAFDESEPPASVIETVPAASVASGDSVNAHPVAPTQPALVCSYERRTGTHRRVRICRKPQSALDEANTQQTFESLRRSQTQVGEPR